MEQNGSLNRIPIMPRKPRPHFDGAVYHVYNRGNNKQAIFHDDRDYMRFLAELDYVQSLFPFTLYAFCLMPNHFHLALKLAHIELERIMQALQYRYASSFNRRWTRVGHLFQGRYKAKLCRTDSYLIQLVSYIHYNPVAGGLVARPQDWPWSSHAEFLNGKGRVNSAFPLSLLGSSRADAVAEYLARMEQPSLELDLDGDVQDREAETSATPPVELEALATIVAQETGLPLERIRGLERTPVLGEARRRLAHLALNAGHRPGVIAAYLGRSPSALSKFLSYHATSISLPGTTDSDGF